MDTGELWREAQVLRQQGQAERAQALVSELLAREPEHLRGLLLLGQLLDERRQPLLALERYEQATALRPRSAAAWNARAGLLRALGRAEEALAAARRAQALLVVEDDNFAETGPVYLTLLLCLRDQRRFPEALAAAEEGLRRSSDAVLAEWASQVEQELARDQEERC